VGWRSERGRRRGRRRRRGVGLAFLLWLWRRSSCGVVLLDFESCVVGNVGRGP
jgi:hypothetical protein